MITRNRRSNYRGLRYSSPNPLAVLGVGCLGILLYLAVYFTGLALVIWFVVTVLRSLGVL